MALLESLAVNNLKRTHQIYSESLLPENLAEIAAGGDAQKLRITTKILDRWISSKQLPLEVAAQEKVLPQVEDSHIQGVINAVANTTTDNSLALVKSSASFASDANSEISGSLIRIKENRIVPNPTWHAPWKLSYHLL